jgi:hypothetical protein
MILDETILANEIDETTGEPKKVGWLEAKLRDAKNEEHHQVALALVATRKTIVEAIEKKCKRVRKQIEDEDDPELSARLKELKQDLVIAQGELAMAVDEADQMPSFDEKAVAQKHRQKLLRAALGSTADKKRLFEEYVPYITADVLAGGIRRRGPVPSGKGDELTKDEANAADYDVQVTIRIPKPDEFEPTDGSAKVMASPVTSKCDNLRIRPRLRYWLQCRSRE